MDRDQAIAGSRFVGFWMRLWAMLIDVAILTVVIGPITLYLYGPMLTESLSESQDVNVMVGNLVEISSRPVFFVISNILPLIALVLFWRIRSATPGKMVFSARIVDARSGGQLATWQLITRALAYLVSTIPLCLGFLWICFDKRKQSWHDKLAKTVVIRPAGHGKDASG